MFSQVCMIIYAARRVSMLKKKRKAPAVKVVLSMEDKRKFAEFFVLLIAADRSIRKQKAAKKEARRSKPSKTRDKQKEIGLRPQSYLFKNPHEGLISPMLSPTSRWTFFYW